MSTELITMDRQYQTRDGRPVRILCVNRDDNLQPVVGLIDGSDLCTWTKEGKYYHDGTADEDDLVPVPKKCNVTLYINVYKRFNGSLVFYPYDTNEDAENAANRGDAIAVAVPVTFEFTEGQGKQYFPK
jgi:hypothetical protein